MYHKLILAGNLGCDPERGVTPTGSPVTNFSVATTERWTASDGKPQDRKIWWRVTAFGVLGKVCFERLKSGHSVLVEGVLHADPATGAPPLWTGRDGQPRASFEVRAQVVKFIRRPQAENSAQGTVPTEPLLQEIPF